MMRTLLLSVFVIALARCAAAEAVLKAWDFAESRSTLGWVADADISGLAATPAGLSGKATGHDPRLVIKGLSITANARQWVEIEMQTDVADRWQLYWSNTSEGPYQGFTPQMVSVFTSRAGGFQTYRVFPFWQGSGRITQIRLDPPNNHLCSFTIKSIRVMRTGDSSSPATEPSWNFRNSAEGWLAAVDARGSVADQGWIVELSGPEPLLLAPAVGFLAEDKPWVTVVMSAHGVKAAQIIWTTEGGTGMQAAPVAVQDDGKLHVYNIDLSARTDWTGNVVAAGLVPSGDAGASLTIESLKFSNARGGPAEVRLARAWTDEVVPRVGDSVTLKALFQNVGGTKSGSVQVLIQPDRGLKAETQQLTVGPLAPGETVERTWKLTARESGPKNVRIECGEAVDAQVSVQPALPPGLRKKQDYVPKPQPVSTGDYLVGCYYYPGWKSYVRWSALEDYPERRPVLGFYREGDPEVADWHIKWAVEHGIGFWVYDWYWSDGERKLEHALHDGFFNARYHDMMKFCLLWANHNPPGSSSLEDMEKVTRYWIDTYFKRSDYLTIDGKPVIVIFSPRRFTDDMGVAGTHKALERSREMCRQAGLPGLYFVACTYPGKEAIQQLEQEGYDALTGYNYPSAGSKGNRVSPYADMVSAYPQFWEEIDAAATIPYIPVADPGWDSRPWHGDQNLVRTGKTPQLFQKMLESARAFEDAAGRRKPGGRKMVLIEAWNELGEGDYIEPHQQWGFDHVDAVRRVFAETDTPHYDLTPRDVGLGPYEIARPPKLTGWEFDGSEAGLADQMTEQNLRDVAVRDGALNAVSGSSDPAVYLSRLDVDTAQVVAVEIRLKVSDGKEGQLFWSPAKALSEARSLRFAVQGDGQFHTYALRVADEKLWKGTVRTLRIDPTDARDADIALDYVRLISPEKTDK